MHLFSPWKQEEEFTVISTIVLIAGVVLFLLALTTAFMSSAR